MVITDLGVYRFHTDGEMALQTLHPGASLDDVRGAMAWEVRVSDDLGGVVQMATHPVFGCDLDQRWLYFGTGLKSIRATG